MSQVVFKNISKKYSNMEKLSVDNFNLEVEKGEFIVFVGPSGCGKSTTLRMLAGLEEISEGEIKIENNIVNDVHPKDRDIAMVFQNYALYPHLSVKENIVFGMRIQKVDKNIIEEKAKWAMDILGLEEYQERRPKDLSGGQRQRVALGRAIVRNPKVFLMDEPLSNLDARLRGEMRNEITKLHRTLNATTIYVTHDQVEAMTMADRIVVLKDGIIQQVGEPMELYLHPQNVFVAGFIGSPNMNIMEAVIEDNYLVIDAHNKIEIPEEVHKKIANHQGSVTFGIRPENCKVKDSEINSFKTQTLKGIVDAIEKMGDENHVFLKINQRVLILKISSSIKININEEITFRVDMNKAHFFDSVTGNSLMF